MNREELNRRIDDFVRRMDEENISSGDPLLERTYARIQQELRDASNIRIPHRQLVEAMQRESGLRIGWIQTIQNWFETLPAPAFTCVCLISIALTIGVMLSIFSPSPSIQNVEWISLETNQAVLAPWIWKQRLNSGRIVEVPNNVETHLKLTDGSTMSVSPNSQISVRYGEFRRIVLQTGALSIDAQPDSKRPMTVTTPLFEVRVTGTVFSISLSP